MHVILELCLSIHLFRLEFFAEGNAHLQEIHKQHQCRVYALNVFTLCMIGANLTTIFAVLFDSKVADKYDGYIFIAELSLLAVVIFVSSITLFKMIKSTFAAGFCDKKAALKITLGIFLSIYVLRAIAKFLIEFAIHDLWGKLWLNHPVLAEFVYLLLQTVYDFLPLVLIFRQHRLSYDSPVDHATDVSQLSYRPETMANDPFESGLDLNASDNREREQTMLLSRLTTLGGQQFRATRTSVDTRKRTLRKHDQQARSSRVVNFDEDDMLLDADQSNSTVAEETHISVNLS